MEISRFDAQAKLRKGEHIVVKPVVKYPVHPTNHQKIMVVLPEHYINKQDNHVVGKVLTDCRGICQ